MWKLLIFCFCPFQLLDTKSSDKKISLLHFIILTVREKFPNVRNFETELGFIEKAAGGKAGGVSD